MSLRTSEIAPDLLGALSRNETQAHRTGKPYLALVASQDTMLHWLAKACREARQAAEPRVKQIHVAVRVNGDSVDQSTIARFERATAWPRNPDETVAAYAAVVDMQPGELWTRAIQAWQTDLEDLASTTEELEAQREPSAGRRAASARSTDAKDATG